MIKLDAFQDRKSALIVVQKRIQRTHVIYLTFQSRLTIKYISVS